LPRKSPEAVESIASNRPITLPLKMTNDTNQVNSTSQPIEMTDLHNRNSDRRVISLSISCRYWNYCMPFTRGRIMM
jgi:hypothetical protein